MCREVMTAFPCPVFLQLFRRVIDSSLALSKISKPGQAPPASVASMKASRACHVGCGVMYVDVNAE